MDETTAEQLKEAGLAHFRNGAYREALTNFDAAVLAFSRQGDEAGRAEMLNNLGVVQYRLKDYTAALAALAEAQAFFEGSGDADRRGQALGNMGDVFAAQGQKRKAAEYYSDAAQLFVQAKEGRKQADVLRTYSLMALRQREILTSINLMSQSLQVRPGKSIGQHFFLVLLRFVQRLMAGR